ncbi:MAG: hydantoinase/oxoprolinase family protein [Gaiellaceae bacterium]
MTDGTSGFRISADVGGTFTDVVVADASGRLRLGKALTTRRRVSEGLLEALARASENIGIDSPSLLAETELFVYGTTHATNAILEGTTAKTAFLVTEGFPDILVRREGGKLNPFDFSEPYPNPYVPRRLTFEIRERVDAQGGVIHPLDERQVAETLGRLERLRVEAVAVCFLWSFANPAHEEAVGRLVERELPGVPYTLSHRLNPTMREYRRASSTVIDASLKPLMQGHLRAIEDDLRAAGLTGELVAAISVGGVMRVEDLVERPIYAVKSGPALAPVAGRTYAQEEAGAENVVVCDTGGTSFDVSLVRDGQIVPTRETWLGPRYAGHLTGLSSVDVRSIGAGGGSIAWLDSGGLVRVGPQSAGADPGPACYGRGGSEPTVTDAALVLGYLDAEFFLGGRMRLDTEAAEAVVGRLAGPLGLSVERTAHAILVVTGEQMVQAIKEITINEGVDPRESLLVAGGGAAGLNIVPIARELGCSRVLVPRTAGALSACGAHYSDIVAEFAVARLTTTADFAFGEVNDALAGLDSAIDDFSRGLRTRGFAGFRTDYSVEAHYPYQVWDVEIPLASGRFETATDVDLLADGFHRAHERIFAVSEPGQQVECVNWKGRLTVPLERPPLPAVASNGQGPPEPLATRRTYFEELGEQQASIYLSETLRPGASIVGPALIEEPTTTIVVYPGSSATVTPRDNYLLEIA